MYYNKERMISKWSRHVRFYNNWERNKYDKYCKTTTFIQTLVNISKDGIHLSIHMFDISIFTIHIDRIRQQLILLNFELDTFITKDSHLVDNGMTQGVP